jgi:outer membrane protein TolC
MNYLLVKKVRFSHLISGLTCLVSTVNFAQQDTLRQAKIIKLEEAIELGIQNNRQLKMANADAAIADENISQAKISKVPRLALNGGYTYIGNPKLFEGFYENSVEVDYYKHQAFVNVISTMPIYTGGAINTKIQQQQLISEMQQTVVKMTQAEVKNAIAEYYFTLEKLYQQIEVTKQNIINTDLRINQLKSRVANGQNLKSDLLRTELQQSNFKVSVFRSNNNIELVSNYLDILIGLPTNTILRPEVSKSIFPIGEIDLQRSLAEAYENRMEIKKAEISLKISESSLSLTKSGFKPNINASLILNSEYPAQWPTYVNIVNFWAAGLSLNWDISSFYDLKHRVKADKFQIDKSNIVIDATKDQIEREVKTAFVKFAESKKNIATYQKDVELSLSNYKIVKSRYDNDFALISDMVDAELQLNNSKIALVNANLDLIIQYYALQYAMGKL